MKEVRNGHTGKLVALRDSFKARQSNLLEEREQRLVEREQLRIVRIENVSCYYNVLSPARPLVHDSMSGECT